MRSRALILAFAIAILLSGMALAVWETPMVDSGFSGSINQNGPTNGIISGNNSGLAKNNDYVRAVYARNNALYILMDENGPTYDFASIYEFKYNTSTRKLNNRTVIQGNHPARPTYAYSSSAYDGTRNIVFLYHHPFPTVHNITAFDASKSWPSDSGAYLWSYEPLNWADEMLYASDSVLIASSSTTRYIILNSLNGQVKWTYSSAVIPGGSIKVGVVSGNTVFIPNWDQFGTKRIYSIDLTTGTRTQMISWTSGTNNNPQHIVAGEGYVVYVTDESNTELYVFDANTKTLLRTISGIGDLRNARPPAIRNGIIYVATPTNVRAISLSTGAVVLTINLPQVKQITLAPNAIYLSGGQATGSDWIKTYQYDGTPIWQPPNLVDASAGQQEEIWQTIIENGFLWAVYATWQINPGESPEIRYLQPLCGDGVHDVALGELCEDGNTNSWDGCSQQCIPESCTLKDAKFYGICNAGFVKECEPGEPISIIANNTGCLLPRNISITATDGPCSITFSGACSNETCIAHAEVPQIASQCYTRTVIGTLAQMSQPAGVSTNTIVPKGNITLWNPNNIVTSISYNKTIDPQTISCNTEPATIRINFTGRTASPRRPLDIMIVLDASGSMATGCTGPQPWAPSENANCPISNAKWAFNDLLGKLDPTIDRVGLVHFHGTGQIVWLDSAMTSNFASIITKINAITTNGGTRTDLGLARGLQELEANGRPDAIQTMILSSDGSICVDCAGVCCAETSIQHLAAEQAARDTTTNAGYSGIITHVLEVYSTTTPGALNEVFNQEIATLGGGSVRRWTIGTGAQLMSNLLQELIREVGGVWGNDAELIDVLPPYVTLVPGSLPSICSLTGNEIHCALGDLVSGVEQRIVFNIVTSAAGWHHSNVYPASRIDYHDITDSPTSVTLPETFVNGIGSSCIPCTISNTIIGPDCATNDPDCEMSENVTISANLGLGCTDNSIVQVNAESVDGLCKIHRTGSVSLHGINTTCTSTSCQGEWTIPFVPASCIGKEVFATTASVLDQQGNWMANDPSPTGSFRFAAGIIPCTMSTTQVTPSCNLFAPSATCAQGERIRLTTTFNGNCPFGGQVQVDAEDIPPVMGTPSPYECIISTQGPRKMTGMNVTCQASPCSLPWFVPAIPTDCEGKLMNATRTRYVFAGVTVTNNSAQGTFQFDPALPVAPSCGNGIWEPSLGEQCDRQDFPLTASCQANGFDRGNLICADNCRINYSACENCGDGIAQEPPEQCDGADWGPYGKTCAAWGQGGGTVTCNPPSPIINDPGECRINLSCSGVPNPCGDGILDGNEQCDGTNVRGYTCDTLFPPAGSTFGTVTCFPPGHALECQLNTSCQQVGLANVEVYVNTPLSSGLVPLPRSEVRIHRPTTGDLINITDIAGMAGFPTIPSGKYQFSARKLGYETVSTYQTLAEGNNQVTITLVNSTCTAECTDYYDRCNPQCQGLNFTRGLTWDQCSFYDNKTMDLCAYKLKGTQVTYDQSGDQTLVVTCCEGAPVLTNTPPANITGQPENIYKLAWLTSYQGKPVTINILTWD